jgi:hypothetical protein
MIGARVLRIIAIAIAIAGVADPTLTREAPVRQPLAIVMVDADAVPSAQRMRALLESDYEITAYPQMMAGAAACPQLGGCIIVSGGGVPARLTAGATVIGGLRPSQDVDAPVITDVSMPGAVHLSATSSLRVRLRGKASRVEVFDGDVLVGATDVGAVKEAVSVSPAISQGRDVNVAWVPIESGARRLTIRAAAAEAQVGVIVSDVATPVLFYEPEATWLGTFIRRALEHDSRFSVVGRTRLAPPVAVTRGGVGPLTSDALKDAGVVIVTAAESLTEAEVDLLERFVRGRGGSVVVVPDRRPTGAVLRLIADVASERRENEPTSVGTLKATEIVAFNAEAPGVSVLESAGGRAIIVSRAIGRGRVIVSGALDAWRYRDDAAFDGFWTALVADAAYAAGPALSLTVDPPVLGEGGATTVTAEWRSLEPLPDAITAEATLTCDDRRSVVRLWPTARPGMFSGTLRPEAAGECVLEAMLATAGAPQSSVDAVRNTQKLKLDGGAVTGPTDVARFESAIAAHGGVVVTAGDESTLARRVRERLPSRRQSHESRPMHSPWWALPFAACLGGEWWLRRRAGLR